MEQTSREVSLKTAMVIIICVTAVIVVAGYYVGNAFFWKPADSRNIRERKLDWVETAYKNNPQSQEAGLAYALALNERGKVDEASKVFDKLVEEFSDQVVVLFNYAAFKKSIGDNQEAKKYFEKVLEESPYYVPANAQYGVLLREDGSYDNAVECFNKALQIEPGAADILFERAKTYYAAGQKDKAITDLKKAIAFVPDFDEAKQLLAKINGSGEKLDDGTTNNE